MNAAEFVAKWIGNSNTEKAASQEHFINLCEMLDEPTPNTDPDGTEYAFEKGATKTWGGDGWADVWRRGRFGWEYKGHHKDLNAAYKQLLDYKDSLENPPLLVVCDLDRFIVRTNFTNTIRQEHSFDLEDLRDHPAEPLRILRGVFSDPDALKPTRTREELTEEAAGTFAQLALDLSSAGHPPLPVAHFLNRLLFCLFAEDAGLLPAHLVRDLTENLKSDPSNFAAQLGALFHLMSQTGGGSFGPLKIQWFNGGLFDSSDVLPLDRKQIEMLGKVSLLDWSQIEPAVFGTLFERGLDPSKRSQLGAHYTDRRSIERVVYPVVIDPLRRELEAVKVAALKEVEGVQLRGVVLRGPAMAARTNAINRASTHVTRFLHRLEAVRVLDPACGSANFLYVALQALKDLEREVLLWEVTDLGAGAMRSPVIGPANVRGIELNSYAAELARVVIWIGEIQWMISNGFGYLRDPILRPLDNIECRDALLDFSDPKHPVEAAWPEAFAIIGNPPFIGGKMMRFYLGDAYVDDLFAVYRRRVPREADFVTYWHETARGMIAEGRANRAGLLATQGIRGGANRQVLEHIKETGDIFLAWSDEPWVVEGAAVHVSIVGFDNGSETAKTLNGRDVAAINANLTAGLDLTAARRLSENTGIAFMGDTKGGPFDIQEADAEALLRGNNPDGRSNADVVRPWINGLDVVRRNRKRWIIDFGELSIEEAALYEAPFSFAEGLIKPIRASSRSTVGRWWEHERVRPVMRAALGRLPRYLVTARVSKYRLFAWAASGTIPDSALIAFARANDAFFGVLQSRVHELWALRMGTQLEDRPRYTPTSTFETFPLPRPNQEQEQRIATEAETLDRLRTGWLDPPGMSAEDLARRTLTALYNFAPAWLRHTHQRLDAAVLDAYGWPTTLSDDQILSHLLELNAARAIPGAPTAAALTRAPDS